MRERRTPIAIAAVLALTVVGVGPALGESGSASAVRHYAIDGRGNPLFKPRHVYFGAHGSVDHISWGDWRGRRAHGHGSVPYNSCVPSCAEGTITRYPVKTIYSRVLTCAGRRTYVRFTYVYRDRMPVGPPRRTSIGFANLCRR